MAHPPESTFGRLLQQLTKGRLIDSFVLVPTLNSPFQIQPFHHSSVVTIFVRLELKTPLSLIGSTVTILYGMEMGAALRAAVAVSTPLRGSARTLERKPPMILR